MSYTNINQLTERYQSLDTTAELRQLVEDITKEMSRTLPLISTEDNKQIRDEIMNERYELKCLRADVRQKLMVIAKSKIVKPKFN